ncbi:MAG: hypothetical protein QOE36_3487 [Gaiellaceae bacterium]|jgi:uncharacterized cupin superfamily protein|nr:hypothetical protein [Gaiellaceae bacterium]
MAEAEIVETEHGAVPRGEGWYVLNAREAQWQHDPAFGADLSFQGDARFQDLGVHLGVLEPGQPACYYHSEENQEGFLVLNGECLLIVEGEERLLGPWDYFHCPPGTAHVLVGAGEGPCLVFAVGARRTREGNRYLVDEAALRHGAGVTEETAHGKEAYAGLPESVDGPAPDLDALS